MKTRTLFLATILAVAFMGCQKDPQPEEEPADVAVGFDENGASLALFSVAEGHTVRFSRGNLQLEPKTGRWRFAENQYDIIGEDNVAHLHNFVTKFQRLPFVHQEGWMDLFSWFVDGWGVDLSSYSKNSDNPDDTIRIDWAWHNAIENGGKKAYFWRTLTSEEWLYLLLERPDADYKRGNGTVDGVNGLVVLPDDWTRPTQVFFVPGFHGYDGTNVYTADEWLLMQEAGAIFLPAEGVFNDVYIYMEGQEGYYWTSTVDYEHSSYGVYSYLYCMQYSSAGTIRCSTTNRSCHACAVRPVLDEVQ
jgi:hypothetical protein